MAPRVRFAPSPTGYLHVGGARTALFNWLYARRAGGTFILRIEDTDAERSSDDMVTGILDGLRWLGLDWDEGPEVGGAHAPYFQSQRLDRYRAAVASLLESGRAYRCYCTPERLREERERAEQRGEAWQYDRACLGLTDDERRARDAAGAPSAVRFRVREGHTAFDDAVHGRIEFDTANVEDFVILRSDGLPTYHLSVVVDDVEMRITDVIRGDDHISNTPKHVLLFEALGAPVPRFAHVPLILGADKKRLSKRHGATSVMEYARQGYLPDAMVNFLALLGWSPGDDRELMTRQELVDEFLARQDQRRKRGLQHRQAGLDERAVPVAHAGGAACRSRAAVTRGCWSCRQPGGSGSSRLRAAARTAPTAHQASVRRGRTGAPARCLAR